MLEEETKVLQAVQDCRGECGSNTELPSGMEDSQVLGSTFRHLLLVCFGFSLMIGSS